MMVNIDMEAVKRRIAGTPDTSCIDAYMDGFRLGTNWAANEAAVVELERVGSDYHSMLEIRDGQREMENGEKTIFDGAMLFNDCVTGLVHRTHSERFGIKYSGEDLFDYDQGFIDAVRGVYEEVAEDISNRLAKYETTRRIEG